MYLRHLVFILAALTTPAYAEVAVLTEHNNLSHTGANLQETILTTTNVNTNTFGLLCTHPVDDQIYAQPLIVTNVTIPGKGSRNLVIVATVNDSVYAFDADDPTVTAPYWQVNFTNANAVVVKNTDLSALGACGGGYSDFSGNIGIVGTPAIDPVAGTIFLVARTKENGGTFVQRLHALDITTGAERPNSPVVIAATCTGTGDGSVGGVVSFDPARNNQRPALILLNGVVYIAWSSHCDLGPYHGWIIGYNTTNLSQAVVYNDTPNGSDGGIWMSAEGISADTNGFLYLVTGNGTVGSTGNPNDPINRGQSFLKLSLSGTNLNVVSWFTPYNYQALDDGDIDLGSAGLILIPGTTLAFSGGKQGIGYLVDRNNMGGLSSSTTADTNVLQTWSLTSDQFHGGMVWWDGPANSYGYIWPASVYLQQYKFDRTTNQFVLPAFAQSPSPAPSGEPGGILALSANGTNAGSGIVWATHPFSGNAIHSPQPGILHAYSAQNVTNELWNSEMISSRDAVGLFAKFVPPTVANGKVYLATFSGQLDVYGTVAGWVAQPVIMPNGGNFTGSTNVTLTSTTPGATIYYTTDGSTPMTNSPVYTGFITLTNDTVIKAIGVKTGFESSGVAVATFLSNSAIGTGTGLKGSYYANQFNGMVVFSDNFSEAPGTSIVGKLPDVGSGAWTGTSNGVVVSPENSLDTTGNARLLFGGFTAALGAGQQLTLTYDTLPLSGNNFFVGWAGISMYTGYTGGTSGTEQIFTGAPNGQTSWGVDGGALEGAQGSGDTNPVTSATFTYIYNTGAWTLTTLSGANMSGTGMTDLALSALRVANGGGADINVDNLVANISTGPEPATFIDPATLVRTDTNVNFIWGAGSPDPSIKTNHFNVRWTGAAQPIFSDTYTFFTTTDDGVRLWINNQLVIDSWTDQSATRSNSITLVGQQRYNIRMDYYHNTGNAVASLSWSTPDMSKVIIPQSQLYTASNPPPAITLTSPAAGSSYTASASVTMTASAAALYNPLSKVDFYAGAYLLGMITNVSGGISNTFAMTATNLGAGNYSLTAVATDLSGLASTSAPINIVVNASTGTPYGMTSRAAAQAFFNMPMSYSGSIPAQLSLTGIFSNTPAMTPVAALIPYNVNTPLWSDNAQKTRYFCVPNNGAPYSPNEQITFTTNGQWSFPAGSVFVKTFQLATNAINPSQLRRLETRLLVRDTNGAAYGVTYKWRADNSDADLLTGSSNENISIITPTGAVTQIWYYPSPSDCLQCHTPAANYMLGPNTRQLNGSFTYPATGQTDNQLRTLNQLGLFNPAFNETNIAGYSQLSAVTNLSASLQQRARSYLDANCSQCHRPGGSGNTFDARYDTPLTNQNIINAMVSNGNLGADNARIVVPQDIWRSVMYGRMNTTDPSIRMPTLARNLIDTNAVQVMADWIHSLPGTPALAPPTITPGGGTFDNSVSVLLQQTNPLAAIYYTLDGSLPTNTSTLFTDPILLTSNLTVRAVASASDYNNSVAANATFIINPAQFTSVALTNGIVHLFFIGTTGQTYVLLGSTNLLSWTPLATNMAPSGIFEMVDPQASQFSARFYRTMHQ
ncbi:MAG TPA: chitobiase/beta-hexosaminidase C-terminal domain-containing protein [Candidatus Sulfotelmatobacter sp.]|nr:chitobiase/beta-hexosaminidase C-terminal domain-containing protein [Candidatus Sulfotelmatobacter sp.]